MSSDPCVESLSVTSPPLPLQLPTKWSVALPVGGRPGGLDRQNPGMVVTEMQHRPLQGFLFGPLQGAETEIRLPIVTAQPKTADDDSIRYLSLLFPRLLLVTDQCTI